MFAEVLTTPLIEIWNSSITSHYKDICPVSVIYNFTNEENSSLAKVAFFPIIQVVYNHMQNILQKIKKWNVRQVRYIFLRTQRETFISVKKTENQNVSPRSFKIFLIFTQIPRSYVCSSSATREASRILRFLCLDINFRFINFHYQKQKVNRVLAMGYL